MTKDHLKRLLLDGLGVKQATRVGVPSAPERVKVCAPDEVWSGRKLVIRLRDR
jgi:hypothetical protein